MVGEGDIAWLLEISRKVARFKDRPQHCGCISRIGPQIAIAQIRRGEQRRAAGKIDQYITLQFDVIARGSEIQPLARGRRWRRIIIDTELERAEMTAGCADRAFA